MLLLLYIMNKIKSFLSSKYFKVFIFVFSISFFIFSFTYRFEFKTFNNWGYLGIFVFNIFSSGIFLIPTLIHVVNPILFVTISSLGMSVNESINWLMGYSSNYVLQENEKEKKVQEYVNRYGYIAIFVLALIPFPFDIVGIIAGRLNYNYFAFLLTIFIARTIRFGVIILLLKHI